MPIYTYQCKDCSRHFELLVGVTSDKSEPVCPECRSRHIQRTLSGFSVGSSHGHDHVCDSCSFEGNCSHDTCPAGMD